MNFVARFDQITDIVEKNINKSSGEIVRLIVETFTKDKDSIGYAFEFIVGYTLSEYIRKRKLCNAYHQKEDTDCPWDDVLELAGYSERRSFDRAFQNEYLSSPAQYLSGKREVPLVERISIWDLINSNEDVSSSICHESISNDEKGHRNMVLDYFDDDDMQQLRHYISLQSIYGLSLKQVMLADSIRNEDVDLYVACSLMEAEYKNLGEHPYTNYEKDCLFLTINYRYDRESAKKILDDVRKTTLLDIRQFDPDYIYAIGFAVGRNGRGGLVSSLSHETFLKLKNLLKPKARDIDFAWFCNNLVDRFTIEEIESILEDESCTKERDLWCVMYHVDETREDAESLVNAIYETTSHKIMEMDTEYLWFIEWPENEERLARAKKIPYEKYCEMKQCALAEYIYNDFDIEFLMQLMEKGTIEFDVALRIVKEDAIENALRDNLKSYAENCLSPFYTPEEIIEMFTKEYPGKIPAEYYMNMEQWEENWNLLRHNHDKWDFITEREELELILTLYMGLTIQESKQIIEKQLKKENIVENDIDSEYALLHYYYFGAGYFDYDDDHLWDKTLISYEMYRNIRIFAEKKAGPGRTLNYESLASIAYDMKYNGMDIEKAFSKQSSIFYENVPSFS